MKNLLKLGKALNKAEQKEVIGGNPQGGLIVPFIDFCGGGSSTAGKACEVDAHCCPGETCVRNLNYERLNGAGGLSPSPLICF